MNNFGIEGSEEALGYGVVYSLSYLLNNEEFIKRNNFSKGLEGKTFIV